MIDKNQFLYPYHRYYGEAKPKNIVFNANLQEFSQQVSYICALAINGNLSDRQAYKQIKSSWKQLKRSKKQLGIGEHSSVENDDESRGCGSDT